MAPRFCCGNNNVSAGYTIAYINFCIRLLVVVISLIRIDDTTNTFKTHEDGRFDEGGIYATTTTTTQSPGKFAYKFLLSRCCLQEL